MGAKLKLGFVVLAVIAALAAAPASASSNDQTLISATGIQTLAGPMGFWLWSQTGGNTYGNNGAGNIYFYALGIADPANVENVSISNGGRSLSEWEFSAHTACFFTATESSPGQGTGTYSCTAKGPKGSAVVVGSWSGQVTITGPGS